MKVLGLLASLALIATSTTSSANDGFELYGGRKKRRTHGLNSIQTAPRNQADVRWDNAADTVSEIYISRDEAPPAPKHESTGLRHSRRLFNGREEKILMLPDRYSVLDFTSGNDKEQNELTSESSWWGRLYVEGFPSPIQYFRAHFGSTPPFGEVKLVLATPLTMCDDIIGLPQLKNENQIDSKTVIVTERSPSCTFGDKAILAHELGAAGVLFINNEPGNFHPAAPIAHDLPISAAMIAQDDGTQLIRALSRVQEANDPGYSLKARYVALICGDDRAAVTNTHSYCHPVEPSDREFVQSLDYKGKMSIEGLTSFEYLQGEFGAWIDPTIDWITVVPNVIGGDSHCCDPAGFEGNEIPPDHAILCQRGECDFATKAENVGITGAGLLIVSSNNATIHRMGSDPPSRGRSVTVATSMVGLESFEHIVDAYYSQLDHGLTSNLAILQPNFSSDSCDESDIHS